LKKPRLYIKVKDRKAGDSVIKKLAAAFLILLLCLSVVLLIDDYKHNSVIPIGIYIDDIHIGGLTRLEAEEKLFKFAKEILQNDITLVYNDFQWLFINVSEHLEIDVNKSLDNVVKDTQKGNIIERFIQRQQLKSSPVIVNPIVKFNEDNLRKTFNKINETIYSEPINAFFKVEADTVSIVDDVEGQILNEDELKEKIVSSLWARNKILEIPIKKCKADITKEDLAAMEIREKVAEYSTKFNKLQKGRTQKY